MLFLHLCAELDSSNVISAIKDNQPTSPYIDTIIEDCIKLTTNFNRIGFSHVGVLFKQTAHYLVKFALSLCL